MNVGKDYKKGDPIRGAALLILSLERHGGAPAGTKEIIRDALQDLGVKEKQARRYLRKHEKELLEALEKGGI